MLLVIDTQDPDVQDLLRIYAQRLGRKGKEGMSMR